MRTCHSSFSVIKEANCITALVSHHKRARISPVRTHTTDWLRRLPEKAISVGLSAATLHRGYPSRPQLSRSRGASSCSRSCETRDHPLLHPATFFPSLRTSKRWFAFSACRLQEATVADAFEETEMGTSPADSLPSAELYRLVAARLAVPANSVRYVCEETRKGATVPFLARYRQDETGHMDEDVLRSVVDTATEVKEVHRRRQFMLKSLQQRGLLTPALQASLERMVHLSQLEDAWEPYKERKNTLAARGREAGLGQFAEPLLHKLDAVEGLQATVAKVDDGERLMVAILSEELQRNEALRQQLLDYCRRTGYVRCSLVQKARKKEAKEMRDSDFEQLRKKFAFYDGRVIGFGRLEAHSALALQRGESKGVLKVEMEAGKEARHLFRTHMDAFFKGAAARLSARGGGASPLPPYEHRLMRDAANSAFEHLVKAALNTIYRDIRKSAEKVSIQVFAHNLQQMLLQRPLSQSRLLAMDPGVRNGVKCVSLDANGSLTSCFKCTLMEEGQMQTMIVQAVQARGVNKVVIGNGTASQETARVVSNTIREHHLSDVEFAIVNEAGASVYSASEVAKEEFPTLDIMYRGAVSIGRRVLDPLSELVKIPVRSMGIGMYQHDVNENELLKALGRVVESCVARVGVNAASANRYVMEKVPGLNKKAVDQIMLARHSRALNSREDLRRVPGMTEAVFQQVAGFFRFPNSKELLDATRIHPESYELARKLLQLHDAQKLPPPSSASSDPQRAATGVTTSNDGEGAKGLEEHRRAETGRALLNMSPSQLSDLAGELRCGVETLRLMAQELSQPGLDPRESLPHAGLMRTTLKDKTELVAGETLTGVVMSVTTFGTFLDCGLHDSVLLRGRGVDRLQIGSLVRNLTFTRLDELGRVQVSWDGVSGTGLLREGLRQHLRLEMEDTVTHPSAATAASSSSLQSSSAAALPHRGQKRARSPSLDQSQSTASPMPALTKTSEPLQQRKRTIAEPLPPTTGVAAIAQEKANEEADIDAAVAEVMRTLTKPTAATDAGFSLGTSTNAMPKTIHSGSHVAEAVTGVGASRSGASAARTLASGAGKRRTKPAHKTPTSTAKKTAKKVPAKRSSKGVTSGSSRPKAPSKATGESESFTF